MATAKVWATLHKIPRPHTAQWKGGREDGGGNKRLSSMRRFVKRRVVPGAHGISVMGCCGAGVLIKVKNRNIATVQALGGVGCVIS